MTEIKCIFDPRSLHHCLSRKVEGMALRNLSNPSADAEEGANSCSGYREEDKS